MAYIGKNGMSYNLSATPFATGGEGEIYNVVGNTRLVAKIYKSGKADTTREHKLIKMLGNPPKRKVLSQIAWVQDVLYENGHFVGFVMPKLSVNEDLNIIYEYDSSKYANMSWEKKIIIAENLCAVLNSVHDAGHVCGDLNPKNISVDPNTGEIVLLDTDSYHVNDGNKTYRCSVGIPEYLSVEVQNKMRGGQTLENANLPTFSKETDYFALAIHIFQLLMNGTHPFTCATIPNGQSSVVAPQPIDNIMKGVFPFVQSIPNARIPSYSPPITILPRGLQILFKRAFVEGHKTPSQRPTPIEWHTALQELRQNLEKCDKVAHHQYFSGIKECPWCKADQTFKNGFLNYKPKAPPSAPAVRPPMPTIRPPSTSSSVSSTPKTSKKKKLPMTAKLSVVIIFVGITTFALINNWFGLFNGWFYDIEYNNVRDFSEGFAAVEQGNILIRRWGFINEAGEEIIPIGYSEVLCFSEGLAAVRVGRKWGFIDTNGNEVIPFIYDAVESFNNGLVAVRQGNEKNGLWGFLDKNGNDIIPLKYESVGSFSEGLVAVKYNGKWGYIDRNDNMIVPFEYVRARAFTNGYARVGRRFENPRNPQMRGLVAGVTLKYGLIDKYGNELTPFIYTSIRDFNDDGLAVVKVTADWQSLPNSSITTSARYGVINTNGTEIIPSIYFRVSIDEDLIEVRTMGNEIQYFDMAGNRVE
jgi:serine/threonine protein kinase